MATTYRQGRNNNSLKIKRLIEDLNKTAYTSTVENVTLAKNCIFLQSEYPVLPEFPSLKATRDEYGSWQEDFHNKCDAAMINFHPSDVFMLGGRLAETENFNQILYNDSDQVHDGAVELVTKAIQLWMEAANQYQKDRVASAKKQLENDGATEAEIADFLKDNLALRKYIGDQRAELRARLESIKRKMEANDIFDLPTKDDLALFAKHQKWFVGGEDPDDEYYPNDGAVHYPALVMEVVALIQVNQPLPPSEMYDVVEAFWMVIHGALSKQGARDAWANLASCPSHKVHDVDIGSLVSQYVSDSDRNIADGEKQSSPIGRSPLRSARICSNFFGWPGTFSLLNAPDHLFIPAAVQMYRAEEQIKDLEENARFITKGADGLYISIACVWLKVLERDSLAYVITGRNDLSVPKIVERIVDIEMSMFDNLVPRSWSLDHDIKGTDPDKTPINEQQTRRGVQWKGLASEASDEESVETQPTAASTAISAATSATKIGGFVTPTGSTKSGKEETKDAYESFTSRITKSVGTLSSKLQSEQLPVAPTNKPVSVPVGSSLSPMQQKFKNLKSVTK